MTCCSQWRTNQLVKASFNLGFHAVETYTVENASQNTFSYYCTYMHKTEGYFCSLCWLSNSPINVPGSIHTFSLEFSLVFQLCSETLPSEGSEHCFSVHIHPFPLSLLPLKPMTLPIWCEYCVDPYSSVEFFCWSKISHCFL